MPWEETEFEIINRLRDLNVFEPDTTGSKWITKFGGWILVEFGELKEEKVPKAVPLNQKFLHMVSFSIPEWTLKSAKKWFRENEQDILDRLALNVDSKQDAEAGSNVPGSKEWLKRQAEQLKDAEEEFLKKTKSVSDSADRVTRYDFGSLGNTEITPQGYLKTDGYLTRTGVFVYHRADGSEFRELRLPEDVFNEDSMKSFENLAVTNGHPTVLLDSSNTGKHSVGSSLPGIKQDGELMRGRLLITDESAIREIKSGKDQISNGYTCDVELIPGTHNGEKYDGIQRNILGNHVAIVNKARGGPALRLTLDSEDNDNADIGFMVDSDFNKKDEDDKLEQKENRNMAKITVDSIEIDVSESAASIVSAAIKKRDELIEGSTVSLKEKQSEFDTLQGKFDSTEAKLKEEQDKKLDEDAISKLVNDLAKEKVVLFDTAGKLLPKEVIAKLDEMSDQEIQIAVIQADPSLKAINLDGKSADYIQAMFESAVQTAKDRSDKADDQTKDVGKTRNDSSTGDIPDADKVRTDTFLKVIAASQGGSNKEES